MSPWADSWAYLDEATLGLCVEALSDEDLLQVAFVMEGEERLTSVERVMTCACARRGL